MLAGDHQPVRDALVEEPCDIRRGHSGHRVEGEQRAHPADPVACVIGRGLPAVQRDHATSPGPVVHEHEPAVGPAADLPEPPATGAGHPTPGTVHDRAGVVQRIPPVVVVEVEVVGNLVQILGGNG